MYFSCMRIGVMVPLSIFVTFSPTWTSAFLFYVLNLGSSESQSCKNNLFPVWVIISLVEFSVWTSISLNSFSFRFLFFDLSKFVWVLTLYLAVNKKEWPGALAGYGYLFSKADSHFYIESKSLSGEITRAPYLPCPLLSSSFGNVNLDLCSGWLTTIFTLVFASYS